MKSLKIGRDNTNDIVINEPRVSRNHATITLLDTNEYEVKDLSSSNGTFVNGVKIAKQPLHPGDRLQVASSIVDWEAAFLGNSSVAKAEPGIHENAFGSIKKTIKVGSSDDNDVVIKNDYVTGHHAKISLLNSGDYFIQDLGSSNGTFVNGIKAIAKNFTKTDVVKIGRADLPNDWFLHSKLKTHFYKDNKRVFWTIFTIAFLIAASTLIYMKRCQWFGWDCNLSANEMYHQNHKALVHLAHQYYYTIEIDGKLYYIGKNKSFTSQTEANTSVANLLPYNTITGTGCFIKTDGSILTSPAITNPWLNETEQALMLDEVAASKTIPAFKRNSGFSVCGETASIKWIPNNVINNHQNFTEAHGIKDCTPTGSTSVIVKSVRKELPKNATVATYYYDTATLNHMHHTDEKYFADMVLPNNNSMISDTFYVAKDTFNINKENSMPVNASLPALKEGAPVFNQRGELIGMIINRRITYLTFFINQLTN